jgi:tetratricopeptide (TPR) repeat protein
LRAPLAIALVLVAVAGLAYQGLDKNDFVGFDDPKYVTANEHVKQGLSADGMRWALTDLATDYWHPVTWMSHMLDVSLFDMWAGGHHLVSQFFHILNSLLLFGFLRYATKRLWPSAFVAALFALHPLHVESVAWVAERKDVLSTFFWFAAMWAYVAWCRKPGYGRYAWVMVLLAFGLMSKPMLVTFPLVLLLLDYWPLERLTIQGGRVKELLIEKIPFAAMCAVAAALTLIGQQKVSAMATLENISIVLRIKNAAVSYWRYVGQMVWPDSLAVLYPYSTVPLFLAVIAIVLLAAATVAACAMKSRRYVLMGWLWYLVTLLPVIGLLQVGPQSHADRYTYVSLTGLFIIIAWLVDDAVGRKASLRTPVAVAAAVALAVLGFLTWKNVGYWRDTTSLAQRAVSVTSRNYVMLRLLGETQMAQGDYEAAQASLLECLRVSPRDDAPSTMVALGRLMYDSGDFRQAAGYGNAALAAQPNLAGAWLVTGMALGESGQYDEAERHIRKAIELSPDLAMAYGALGKILGETDRVDEAIAMYERAVEINPGLADVHFNLGVLHRNRGQFDEAAAAYGRSIEAGPTFEAWNGLGDCMVAMGQPEQARKAYLESVKLNPEEAVTRYNLSLVLMGMGSRAEAIQEARKALSLAPENPDARELLRRLTEEQP